MCDGIISEPTFIPTESIYNDLSAFISLFSKCSQKYLVSLFTQIGAKKVVALGPSCP